MVAVEEDAVASVALAHAAQAPNGIGREIMPRAAGKSLADAESLANKGTSRAMEGGRRA